MMMKNIRKILVINTAFLGDVILTTPLIRELKRTLPFAEIHILVIPQNEIVFKYNPYLSKIHVFDKRDKSKKLSHLVKLIRRIKNEHYDAAISITKSSTSSIIMYLSGIACRVGFSRQKLLTNRVKADRDKHVRERYLYLLSPFTSEIVDTDTEIFIGESEKKVVADILRQYKAQGKILIGIAPGSVWTTKRWLKEYFIELILKLKEIAAIVFLIGGKDDMELCADICSATSDYAINLAGRLTVLKSAELIRRLDLMITNDSAPLHLANAVKTDVISIFGPTVKAFGCYPYRENDIMAEIHDLDCRPCSKHGGNTCPEKHFRCMKQISPGMLYKAVITLLAKQKKVML